MAGPQNAIIGDDYGTDIPVTNVPETQLDAEKKAARYSKSSEYKRIKQHMQERIEAYQKYLPGGEAMLDPALQGHRWAVATEVIAELQAVMNFYDTAEEVVKDAEKNQ